MYESVVCLALPISKMRTHSNTGPLSGPGDRSVMRTCVYRYFFNLVPRTFSLPPSQGKSPGNKVGIFSVLSQRPGAHDPWAPAETALWLLTAILFPFCFINSLFALDIKVKKTKD